MIRRGFWLAAGAVLGVTAYRRVTRLGRGLTGGAMSGALPAGTPAARPRPGGTATAGSDLRRSPGHQARRQRASTVARLLAAARFARDVRAGMAEYLDLHHRELARTLGSRSGRVSSG